MQEGGRFRPPYTWLLYPQALSAVWPVLFQPMNAGSYTQVNFEKGS